MDSELLLFSGNANPELSQAIADYLNIPLDDAFVGKFSDGEVQVQINTSVRDFDVFVVQSLSSPVNDHLMELLVMMDALRRSSARRITAVVPYFGYARQDRQPAPRTPITAKLVADMFEVGGADRVVAMDLHAGQIQGFFSSPFEHLYSSPVLISAIRELGFASEDIVIVSPDSGGVERARHYSKSLKCPLAILDKRRSAPNVAEVIHLIGDVEGKRAIIIDDMIDTAGTLTQAATALRTHGAASVYAAATHPILSGPAIERIAGSDLDRVIVTDTIPLSEEAKDVDKIEVVSVARVMGEAIRRIHGGTSVSSLFTSVNS
ncbi:MAG: ribose-phosphate pyrophosphokinase [Myxococcota bacterium]